MTGRQADSRLGITSALALSFALLLLIVSWSVTLPTGILDDAIQLTGAMFYLQGQQPCVDFNSVYPPLNYYLIAAAFRVLGVSSVTYRIVQTVAYLVILSTLGVLLRRGHYKHWPPLALGLIALTAPLCQLQVLTALMWSALAALSILSAHESSSAPNHAWFVTGGICLGALLLTRINFGLYLLAAWAIDLLLPTQRGAPRPWLRILSDGCWFALAASFTVAALVVAWGGPLPALWTQTVLVPARALIDYALSPVSFDLSTSALRQALIGGLLMTPLPVLWLALQARSYGDSRMSTALLYLAGLIVLCVAVLGRWRPTLLPAFTVALVFVVIFARTRFAWLPRQEWFLLLLLSLQMHYMLSRPDGSHSFALFPTIGLLIAVAVPRHSHRKSTQLLALVAVVCGPAALYNLVQISHGVVARAPIIRALPILMRTEDEALYGRCGSTCGLFHYDPQELAASAFIRERARPDEPVFSGLLHHAQVEYNDISAYWLMRRPPGTRYVLMMQGISTGAEQERQVITDLRQRDVRRLLLWAFVGRHTESRTPSLSRLDAYIREHFSLERRFGNYEVWRRNGVDADQVAEPRAVRGS